MSIYGQLVCLDCRLEFWLGKAVFRIHEGRKIVDYFHIGDPSDPPNWKREELNRVIWKMLADHIGHNLRVLFDYELAEQEDGIPFRVIGGDSIDDISIDDYLNGRWRPD